MTDWISAKDRLPEYGILVKTLFSNNKQGEGMRLFCNSFIGLKDNPHPIAWRPLRKNDY